MRRVLLPAVVLTWSALAVLPVSPAAAAPASGGYTTYVACAKNTADQAEHQCDLGSTPVAVFVSKNHDATFKVCAKFPGKKQRLCATAQQADKGKRRLNTITTDKVGTHKVTWYVDGDKVGTWTFDIVEG